MGAPPLVNSFRTTLASGITAGASSMTLSDATGAPVPTTQGYYTLSIWNSTDYTDPRDDSDMEIVLISGRSGNVLTIARRGFDGTTAAAHNTGGKTYSVEMLATASAITWNVRAWGATGDGTTDDTTAVSNAITDAAAGQFALYFPKGTYDVPTLTAAGVSPNARMKIYGDGKHLSIIQGGGTSSFNFWNLQESLECADLGFTNFERVFTLDAINSTVDLIEIRNCRFEAIKSVMKWTATVDASALIETFRFVDNVIDTTDAWAVELWGKCDASIVRGNYFQDITRGAIQLGNDSVTSGEAAFWNNVIVTENNIENVTEDSVGAHYGIRVNAKYVNVTNNTINGVTSGTDTSSEAHGIYCKFHEGTISFNTISGVVNGNPATTTVNADGIRLKGSPRSTAGAGTYGYSRSCIGNTIDCGGIQAAGGIFVASGGEILCTGNIIDNVGEDGFGFHGNALDSNNSQIVHNIVRGSNTTPETNSSGVIWNGSGHNVVIHGNTIRNIEYGVAYTPAETSGGDPSRGIDISHNQIYNCTEQGIRFVLTTVTVDGASIVDNQIFGSSGTYGINVSGTIANFRVSGNLIDGFTTARNGLPADTNTGKPHIPLFGWWSDDVPANQTSGVAMRISGGSAGNAGQFIADKAGSIVGLSFQLSDSITAGTITVRARIDNNTIDPSYDLVLSTSNPDRNTITIPPGTETFAAGDRIDASIYSDSGLLPNGTIDAVGTITIEYD